MRTATPTDEQILAAPKIALVDDSCDCWSVIIYPRGAAAVSPDCRQGLCIAIDSSKVNVIEAWHERIQQLRPE
ncbi:MAG: hypothetical protein U0872_15465 [Planctomycetaceae bacterium]